MLGCTLCSKTPTGTPMERRCCGSAVALCLAFPPCDHTHPPNVQTCESALQSKCTLESTVESHVQDGHVSRAA